MYSRRICNFRASFLQMTAKSSLAINDIAGAQFRWPQKNIAGKNYEDFFFNVNNPEYSGGSDKMC